MDLRKQMLSEFRLLRKKRIVPGENVQNFEAFPFTIALSNSSVALSTDVAGTFTLSSKRRGKEIVTLEEREDVPAQTLGENDPPLSSINDALRMAWELSWNEVPGKLAQMAKAYPEVDTEVLEHIEVFDVESEEYEDEDDPIIPLAP
ncbi:hypothetical protein F0562_018045 [Nyssa sinensis]|uniref:Uncharacterized protein n=1 Tax=Nyssa sinensis TaxID=561372 RepID=A0A5J4ZB01_9ASTE|nr:hypothetical protein F0562_018045 [Nyssa sinensis]